MTAYAAERPTFDTSISTIQNLESYVTVDNNKDGTITLHMPNLSSTSVNTKSALSKDVAALHTLHYGYEKGSDTSMTPIGKAIAIHPGWCDHTPFTELDKVVDISLGQPRTAIFILGHLQATSCPGGTREAVWGLYRYNNPVKVTYNLNGGSIEGKKDNKSEYLFEGDTLQTTFAEPVLDFYNFDGWFTQAEGGTMVTAKTAQNTYYAHWTKIDYPLTPVTSGKSMDGTFSVKCDRPDYMNLVKVYVDDNLLDTGCYHVTEGSTIVNFHSGALAAGEHKITLEYSDGLKYDGNITASYETPKPTVQPTAQPTAVPEVPKTGDNSKTSLCLVLLTASIATLLLVLRRRTSR